MLLRKLNRVKSINPKDKPNKVFEVVTKLIEANCYITNKPRWLKAVSNNKPVVGYVNKLNSKFNKPLAHNTNNNNGYFDDCFYYEPYKAKDSNLVFRFSDNPTLLKVLDPKTKKLVRMKKRALKPKPYEIRYDLEDSLRQRFFKDHPFELMRPMCLIEEFSSTNNPDNLDKIGVDYSFIPTAEE